MGAAATAIQDRSEWLKAIETGHGDVDAEHMRLFDLLDQLRCLSNSPLNTRSVIADTIEQLHEYASFHFANEELIMDSAQHPGSQSHKAAHQWFAQKIEEIKSSEDGSNNNIESVVNFIYDWLVSHICSMDQAMIASIAGQGHGFNCAISGQTDLVINTALNVASYLETMTARLNATTEPARQALLRQEIDGASERLLNLVSLADSRISNASSGGQDQRLARIKQAVSKSACNLMEQYAVRVINYGTKILTGKTGIPLGGMTVITQLIGAIKTLSNLIGDSIHLTIAQAVVIIRSFEIANDVAILVTGHFEKTRDANLFGGVTTSFQVPASIQARVSSQAHLHSNFR